MLTIKWFLFILIVPTFVVFAENLPLHFFQNDGIKAIGVSAEGQSKYAALTSAEVIAKRNLVEMIKGVSISSVTHMKNSKITSDIIETRVQGLIVGATSCGKKYFQDKGYAEVCLQIPMHGRGGVFDAIFPVIKEFVPKDELYAPTKKVKQENSKPFDGLIVDVRHQALFQPSIINRILDDNGRVVYEPSMISHKLLIEAGAAQFAITRGKAEAILADSGSVHPLFVKSESIKYQKDAVVSSKDAALIYANNQQSNMLHRARVVFLLK